MIYGFPKLLHDSIWGLKNHWKTPPLDIYDQRPKLRSKTNTNYNDFKHKTNANVFVWGGAFGARPLYAPPFCRLRAANQLARN